MEQAADAKEAILAAAERKFAACGYAGTSVQDIVSATNVSKPTLYYYFENKAGLFNALVDYAYDECFALMQEAAKKSNEPKAQLEELLTALFGFLSQRKDLTRIVYSTAFAAPGELPENCSTIEKRKRNFEFVHSLIKRAIKQGILKGDFNSKELTAGIYGAMSFHIMSNLFCPEQKLNRHIAERIVKLFMEGAKASKGQVAGKSARL